MLNANQLSGRIAAVSARQLSIDEFERWFRKESRDFHLWGDVALNEAVLAVEAVFSEYHFADLGDAEVREGLANAVRALGEMSRVSVKTIFVEGFLGGKTLIEYLTSNREEMVAAQL